ncbi:hypothetical protein ABZY31_28295 [Streptomyces sp. NPDC006529]
MARRVCSAAVQGAYHATELARALDAHPLEYEEEDFEGNVPMYAGEV